MTFPILKRMLEGTAPGCLVEIQFSDSSGPRPVTGIFQEVVEDGLILVTYGRPQYFSCGILERLSVLSNPSHGEASVRTTVRPAPVPTPSIGNPKATEVQTVSVENSVPAPAPPPAEAAPAPPAAKLEVITETIPAAVQPTAEPHEIRPIAPPVDTVRDIPVVQPQRIPSDRQVGAPVAERAVAVPEAPAPKMRTLYEPEQPRGSVLPALRTFETPAPAQPQAFFQAAAVPSSHPAHPQPAIQSLTGSAQSAHLLGASLAFAGPVAIAIPLPSFNQKGLGRDAASKLIRWKNIYENALKQREMARLRAPMQECLSLAKELKDQELFRLAGIFAINFGDLKIAEEALEFANELDDPEASAMLAHLAQLRLEWRRASEMLCRHILLSIVDGEPSEDALLNLGRCISHLEDRDVKGLGEVVDKCRNTPVEEVAFALGAYALEMKSSEAANLVRSGRIEEARTVAGDANTFTTIENLRERMRQLEEAEQKSAQKSSAVRRLGKITMYSSSVAYGFLTDAASRTIYFFHKNHIQDSSLLAQLTATQVGQSVTFASDGKTVPGKSYPSAVEIEAVAAESAVTAAATTATNTPKVNYASIPKGSSPYAKAKRAELDGDLDACERFLREEIKTNGSYRGSAVMDLATLFIRKSHFEEAVNLLKQHRPDFPEKRSIDNHLASALVHALRYKEAGQVFRNLQYGSDSRTRTLLQRQEAFCLYASGNYPEATKVLAKVLLDSPDDQSAKQLLDNVKTAQSMGKQALEAGSLPEMFAFEYGYSAMSRFVLESCDFSRLDERSRARGFFDHKDFEVVTRVLETTIGRRPREKAELFLHLAAMAERSPEPAGDKGSRFYLGRALAFMGERSLYESSHPDVARAYLTEALRFSVREESAEKELSLLLITYLNRPPDSSTWPQDWRWNTSQILRLFKDDAAGLSRFRRDLPYFEGAYPGFAALVGKHGLSLGLPVHDLINADTVRSESRSVLEHLRNETASAKSLTAIPLSAGQVDGALTVLRQLSAETRFDLDRIRMAQLAHTVQGIPAYLAERDFIEKENKNNRLCASLDALARECREQPTKLSVEVLLDIGTNLRQGLATHFETYSASVKAALSVRDILGSQGDYYLADESQVVRIKLEVSSLAGGAPIEAIDVIVSIEEGLTLLEPCHSPELLRGGERREVELSVRPSARQLEESAFTIRLRLRYRARSGEQEETEELTIPVRLGSRDSFQPIENRYHRYAGGKSIDVNEPDMFFGRKELIGRMTKALQSGGHGTCFLVYGQKRSGKTSILKRVEAELTAPTFSTYLSIGRIGSDRPDVGFSLTLRDTIQNDLLTKYAIDEQQWPTTAECEAHPKQAVNSTLQLARRTLSRHGWQQPRIVLLIDEFSLLYRYIVEKKLSPDFMHFWKSLIDGAEFSAVLAGQDTMPRFIRAFQNELAVTKHERISYLSEAEAEELATKPIQLDGKSRYRGKAISRLLELTAGSPFYLQKLCDRLVRHLNMQRAVFITEADVNIAAQYLLYGDEALHEDSFDALIAADGEIGADAAADVYLRLLRLMSRPGGFSPWEGQELSEFATLIRDLEDRDVVRQDAGGRFQIRVGLFAEWLRGHRTFDFGDKL